MNSEAERISGDRVSFKENLNLVWKAVKRPEIFCVLLFFILDGLTSPTFWDFTYYFVINEAKITKF